MLILFVVGALAVLALACGAFGAKEKSVEWTAYGVIILAVDILLILVERFVR